MSTAYPSVLAATDGLDRHLARIPDYVRRARVLAGRLEGICLVNPRPPCTNGFQVLLNGTPSELRDRHRQFARSEGIWLFNAFNETQFPAMTMMEIVIGDAADHYSDEEVVGWLSKFARDSDVETTASAETLRT